MLLPPALCLLAAFAASPALAQPPIPRLQVRLEVSKKISEFFTGHENDLSLKNRLRLFNDFRRFPPRDKFEVMNDRVKKLPPPLWSNWDVELVAADVDTNIRKDPTHPNHLLIQIQLHNSSPREVNPRFPPLANPMYDNQSEYYAIAEFSFRCADVQGTFRDHVTCRGWPSEAILKTIRLAALEQLDDSLRKALADRLIRPARKDAREKAGSYLENPFPFTVQGNYHLPTPEKKLIPFRLPPDSSPLWVDAGNVLVRDLFLSPPDKLPTRK